MAVQHVGQPLRGTGRELAPSPLNLAAEVCQRDGSPRLAAFPWTFFVLVTFFSGVFVRDSFFSVAVEFALGLPCP